MSTSLNPEPNLNPAISINQGQKKQAPAKAPKRRPLATMKPRVRCAKSPCDFAGKQGPESEYLKDVREAKSTNKSKKDMTRSFKDKYLTLKKNICNLQKVHGVEAEFALIVKNYLQIAGGMNASTTAGRFMVVCDGTSSQKLGRHASRRVRSV